jgi:hypothetical protein
VEYGREISTGREEDVVLLSCSVKTIYQDTADVLYHAEPGQSCCGATDTDTMLAQLFGGEVDGWLPEGFV